MDIKHILKLSLAILLLVSCLDNTTHSIFASENINSSSATLKREKSPYEFDSRIVILKNFLKEHNSPLAEHADTFINVADTYDLDWRFVPAITGVESTFGKRIPYNSYNAYGWNSGNYYFDSWDHSIDHVSKYLRENYINDGLTSVNKIAKRYAASPDWAWKVKYFQKNIDPLPLEFTL